MQHRKTAAQSSGPLVKAQAINELKLRVLQAKSGFLALGTANYMPFIEMQAQREKLVLTIEEKARLRQVMNCNLSIEDAPRVELIVRSLEAAA